MMMQYTMNIQKGIGCLNDEACCVIKYEYFLKRENLLSDPIAESTLSFLRKL